MAADRPLAERGTVEVKMGRSKFPGKPSKIGNRKRVNLSSCTLPEDNDSSKAAKNIYLGLSVFNETFGDNEMVAPGPFDGFSAIEVEKALAEARLQQNEAETELKKHGIHINLWESFQNELLSIITSSSYNNTKNSCEINKATLSFDGGGHHKQNDSTSCKSEDNQTTKGAFRMGLKKDFFHTPKRKIETIRFQSSQLRLSKLKYSPKSNKSLQSQAARRLLEKAKMSNTIDTSKTNKFDKKFVLPCRSIRSSRIIKPSKKFLEDSNNKKSVKDKPSCASERKKVKERSYYENSIQIDSNDAKVEVGNEENRKMANKDEFCTDVQESKCSGEIEKNNLQLQNRGKIILREPRLHLVNGSCSLPEGPFSSSSTSSLNLNSQLKVNSIQSVTSPENVICAVCGIVRFYKFVDLAKKFGVFCCEFCRKFISKIIKSSKVKNNLKFQCVNGKGLCELLPIAKDQHFDVGKGSKSLRCHACWLKSCLKNFKMPVKLKHKLLKLLPVNMQMGIGLELNPLVSNKTTNKFVMSKNNNLKDFKWLNQNSYRLNEARSTSTRFNKQLNWSNTLETFSTSEKCLRKRKRTFEIENKMKFLTQKAKVKVECDEKNRQKITLKGPRVKHVCRSASVALGQPLATFPNEPSPAKKPTYESAENCNNCDNLFTTNNLVESQEVLNKFNKEVMLSDIRQEKKPKQVSILKTLSTVQQSGVNKPKKKGNVKVENPVCMDFWESYDPDEVSEIGFGLIGSEPFSVRALCFLCGSSGQERLIHCASCCEPYHEFCVDEGQLKLKDNSWKYDWVCPRCTVCITCGRTSGQQLKCVKCDHSYHIECVDRVGGRLLHSPDRPWVCSVCLRCKSCNGVDVSVFVGNLPLCKACFVLRQKGNYCPLCQRCYEDDDYDSKMMECGQCKCWVHAKCEGLSDEKYQVLSFLPESVEYICRMCCVMPPAPWWLAVEAELKSGYLGVLKALSKNRRACTMLKWSPRKQCTCKHVNFVSRVLDFEENKSLKLASNGIKNDDSIVKDKGAIKSIDHTSSIETNKGDKCSIVATTEKKTNIEVINHPTESLKLTLKIMKGAEADESEKLETCVFEEKGKNSNDKINFKETVVRVKKCLLNEENSEDSLTNIFGCQEDSHTLLQSLFKKNDFINIAAEPTDKRSLSSPLNPPSDSGIGSTDDELKANCLTDEESCRLDDQQPKPNGETEGKSHCDTAVSFVEEKRECFCFLEVDSYNSRSKPFSPNLMSIKKKVTTSEYSSLHQFHQDMQRMISTTQSEELMDLYHQTIKEIFPWFDPKFSRVQSNSQKLSGTLSVDSTPVKSTPTKSSVAEECRVPKEKLLNQPLEFFYCNYVVEDNRMCLMCKSVGDGPPGETGRLLYCGQNEWVHCNCALWSGEVFEEIDGSLQNVHSAISRGRSIRCPECSLKGASIGCCARNCQETYHFKCARQVGCAFMDDKTVYCPAHVKESIGKIVQKEKEFELRRPVYVELDKRRMKMADSSQIKFAVGSLHVNNLGRFVLKLSDQPEAIIPEQFECTRLFWSCYEPWKIVRYYFSVRLVQVEDEGIDYGVNITIDHSREPEYIELKLKQLKHFQEHKTFLDINEKEKENIKEKGSSPNLSLENINKTKGEGALKVNQIKRIKNDQKSVKKMFDQFDSKEDDNCLSDNQNTTGLLPPDLEEAIFRDLPHDILDGISMQDIFMDIKNDSYENCAKDGIVEYSEGDYISESSSNRLKKNESNSEVVSQIEIWNEFTDDSHQISKPNKEFKKYKTEVLSNHQLRKSPNLKTYQKSYGFSRNCKVEGSNNKWKKGSKCHLTVNLLESQDRGETLQELKFTDGLVSVTTGTLDHIKDLKARLEDSKHSIQQEEGKENKCLQWHTRLQPRLLQVDGNLDSSSSGSEAGESPQRLLDESINSKIVPLPNSSSKIDSPVYSISSSVYGVPNSYENVNEISPPDFSGHFGHSFKTFTLPQLDGISGSYCESSDSEESEFEDILRKRRKRESDPKNMWTWENLNFKISQFDGGMDSESDDGETLKFSVLKDLPVPLKTSPTKEEPVKCNQCHCTYRTKMSYQRHLEACCNDFMLSSSEEEISDDESLKKLSVNSNDNFKVKEASLPIEEGKTEKNKDLEKEKNNVVSGSLIKQSPTILQPSESEEKMEIKKEKSVKRTYTRKKPIQVPNKTSMISSFQQVQQNAILVQQPNATPTIIVQDLPAPNLVPATFLDSGTTIGYVTTIDTQNAFAKSQPPHLIATSNGFVSGNFQFPSVPETQIFGGVCLNPSNMQANVPSFLIQQPHPPSTLVSPQPGHIMMSNDGQMMVGHTGLYEIIRDGSGGMFLASRNQPVFYNTETIVSNTVMQTNQFVSNVLATSFSQTSTQIFQARELEQVVNLPSNYIFVGPNPAGAGKILSSDDLICVQPQQTLISSNIPIQIPNQTIFNPSLQNTPIVGTEAKMISSQLNPIRYLQPVANNSLPSKSDCSSLLINKIVNANTQIINQPVPQIYRPPDMIPASTVPNGQMNAKPLDSNKISDSCPKSMPIMRPNMIKTTTNNFEKPGTSSKMKFQQVRPRSRALVDYINNFKSDAVDVISGKEILKHNQLNCNENDKVFTKNTSAASESVAQFKSKGFASDFEKRLIPSGMSNDSVTLPDTRGPDVKTEEQLNENTVSAALAASKPSLENVTPEVSDTANSNCSISPNGSEKLFPILPLPKKEEDVENNANLKPQNISSSPNILSNMTNSSLLDKEQKSGLSLPSLEDASSSPETHFPKTYSQISLPYQKQTSEIFPLQESPQSNNAVCKSPKGVSPDKHPSSPPEPNGKHKQKGSSHNQNIKLATLPVKFCQMNKDENLPKNIENENGKFTKKHEEKGPKLIFDVTSDDGYKNSSTSMSELWAKICDSVQEMRAVLKIPPLPVQKKGREILGMQNHGLQYCLEQLRGVEQCIKYKCKYFIREESKKDDEEDLSCSKENLSGCARAEQFITRKEYDMFGWLASKHRRLPKLTESAEETLSSIRRANSLPMAMRYRNLKETAKLYVGVYRSKIHGKGLFCLREIEAGEMVIEYAGEVIRSTLTDKREKYYTDKGIGCYMFRIDDHFVIDATMKGNAARFINHSCEPNCYSRVVDILGKKHIVIFALRRINIMEELTYDYKFPFEDEKISCHCLSKKCRKYLN